MPPKLRVLAHNARLDQRLQSEISSSLASVLKTNPKMTPKEAMWSITNEMLTNNPFQPPKDGKCPINDLPDEVLGYIFSVGVKEEEEEELAGYDSEEDEGEWEDMSTDDEGEVDEDESEEEGGASGTAAADDADAPFGSDSEGGSDTDSDMYSEEVNIPFQVLVSHVCKRWRVVALDSHVLWTTLNFANRPNLEKAGVYISRAKGLPLNICIDCTFPEDVDEEDHPDHPLYLENKALHKAHKHHCEDPELRFLSQKELAQILDLIEPEVSHWGSLDFRASTYGYVHLLLSRLHVLPSAPLLESFQVYHFEDCEDYEFFSGDDKTSFLPFHGDAPLLKDAVLWGVHIDWEGAIPSFLRGLHEFELSFHAKDVRPSYSAFAQIIANSPELHTLTLSLSGPALPDSVAFDAEVEEGGWGSTLLAIPSLREFALQFHDPKYAAALVQHLDMPGLTSLLLNFDEEDYTSFVRALLTPVKGRTEGLLKHIDHLKIAGMPCDVATVEAFLGQLGKLKSFNLKVVGAEEAVIFQKLIDPAATPITPAPGVLGPLPSIFCPALESITTNEVTGAQVKELVIARRKLGAPLKRVFMSHNDLVTKKEEKWLRENVEELDFFEPSDSEDEVDEEVMLSGYGNGDNGHEDDDDDEDEEEDDDDDVGDDGHDHGPPLLSPLARHLGRGRGRRHHGMDLD
ncbi:hypothetical protein BDZ97DRAFT_1700473 [Flammula alnicola]|nr:hypothetical protein BDZ97DRAFT_1700473 [Flammula alnicola]